MWKTVLFLTFTLIIVPVAAFYFDDPLSSEQYTILQTLIVVYLICATLCFVTSTLTNNVSQVDKLWSIMPIAYSWVVVEATAFEPRIVLMATLVAIWGIRLTLNFARRGGYSWKFWSGEEDYRWAVLRQKPEFKAPWKWFLFNLFFISLYQMGLILLITLPILKSVNGTPLSWADYLLSILFLIFVIIETIADQQQWNYQKEKSRKIQSGEPLTGGYKKGFMHSGLWAKVRHPNYAAEQAIWICFYFFSVIATQHWINWSIAGCLLLILLFKGSSDFSEGISVEKYREYEKYQKNVPRFFPIKKGAKK